MHENLYNPQTMWWLSDVHANTAWKCILDSILFLLVVASDVVLEHALLQMPHRDAKAFIHLWCSLHSFLRITEELKMKNMIYFWIYHGFPGGSEVKASSSNAGDPGSILGLGRSPGEGNGNPLQYPCLENLMDRGAW